MPDAEDPKPPNDEAGKAPSDLQPAQLTENGYMELSDEQMDIICEKAEAMQESRDDVEVEYSVSYTIHTYLHVFSSLERGYLRSHKTNRPVY